MQIKTFTIPILYAEQSEELLNKFLRSHRILHVDRQFCPDNGGYWSVLIEYADGDPVAEAPPAQRGQRKDPAEQLSEGERQRYDRLRALRKELANKHGIPAYLVFTNEELALLSKPDELTEESAKGIKGIAPQRLKDYLQYFITATHEESRQPDATDSVDGESA